jgi:hypothetical protein
MVAGGRSIAAEDVVREREAMWQREGTRDGMKRQTRVVRPAAG